MTLGMSLAQIPLQTLLFFLGQWLTSCWFCTAISLVAANEQRTDVQEVRATLLYRCLAFLLLSKVLKFYLSTLFASRARKSLLSRWAWGSRVSSLTDGAGLSSGSLSEHHTQPFSIIYVSWSFPQDHTVSNKTYLWSHNSSRSRWSGLSLETLRVGGKCQ